VGRAREHRRVLPVQGVRPVGEVSYSN
jgi:hypothetical protein